MADFTHAKCGGKLSPEQHRRWTIDAWAYGQVNAPYLSDNLETLHRCDECGLIGVAHEPTRRKANLWDYR